MDSADEREREEARSGTVAGTVRLELDGAIATITNDNPEKHNAFDDDMDAQLFDVLAELRTRAEVRAVIWRGEGKSFSSGRDVGAISGGATAGMTHHELMRRGHRGIRTIFELDAPIVVALQGWAMGGSFQRALLCDIRVAAEGARFRLPEVGHGVIPDTGGVARLFQMCGHGVAADMVLTGRVMGADEALGHGIVSRVVPSEHLDDEVRAIAAKIAEAPAVTVRAARRILGHLAVPEVIASMDEEMIAQTFVRRSDDMVELQAARAEDRPPEYKGS
ncbi:MAG TPA: enoyl-CoA hydratase/isomerase family protein [Acidimicrobiales bacterium]|nr:enoyl-CoA hydratase/isomerase family protein [Acidimicrobiales bacterium]